MKLYELKLQAARYALGFAKPNDLVDAALDAMREGFDSDELACLAGAMNPDMNEVAPLFRGTLKALGLTLPSREAAVQFLIRDELRELVSHKTIAIDGMPRLFSRAFHVHELHQAMYSPSSDFYGLRLMIQRYAIFDGDENPMIRPSFRGQHDEEAIQAMESEIRKLAEQWLEDHPGPTAFQITYETKDALAGAHVARCLKVAASISGATHCIPYCIEGGGETLARLVALESETQVVEVSLLLPLLEQMDGIDWADYFLGYPLPNSVSYYGDGYIKGMSESKLLFRCIDSSYLMIYGIEPEVGKALQREFDGSSLQLLPRDDLLFPR